MFTSPMDLSHLCMGGAAGVVESVHDWNPRQDETGTCHWGGGGGGAELCPEQPFGIHYQSLGRFCYCREPSFLDTFTKASGDGRCAPSDTSLRLCSPDSSVAAAGATCDGTGADGAWPSTSCDGGCAAERCAADDGCFGVETWPAGDGTEQVALLNTAASPLPDPEIVPLAGAGCYHRAPQPSTGPSRSPVRKYPPSAPPTPIAARLDGFAVVVAGECGDATGTAPVGSLPACRDAAVALSFIPPQHHVEPTHLLPPWCSAAGQPIEVVFNPVNTPVPLPCSPQKRCLCHCRAGDTSAQWDPPRCQAEPPPTQAPSRPPSDAPPPAAPPAPSLSPLPAPAPPPAPDVLLPPPTSASGSGGSASSPPAPSFPLWALGIILPLLAVLGISAGLWVIVRRMRAQSEQAAATAGGGAVGAGAAEAGGKPPRGGDAAAGGRGKRGSRDSRDPLRAGRRESDRTAGGEGAAAQVPGATAPPGADRSRRKSRDSDGGRGGGGRGRGGAEMSPPPGRRASNPLPPPGMLGRGGALEFVSPSRQQPVLGQPAPLVTGAARGRGRGGGGGPRSPPPDVADVYSPQSGPASAPPAGGTPEDGAPPAPDADTPPVDSERQMLAGRLPGEPSPTNAPRERESSGGGGKKVVGIDGADIECDRDAGVECCVCLAKEKNVVFMPCKHLCCCNECAGSTTECPLCRITITAKIEVYM